MPLRLGARVPCSAPSPNTPKLIRLAACQNKLSGARPERAREARTLPGSNREWIRFGQFALVPHACALERLDRLRFVDVNDGVELL